MHEVTKVFFNVFRANVIVLAGRVTNQREKLIKLLKEELKKRLGVKYRRYNGKLSALGVAVLIMIFLYFDGRD